MSRKITVSGVGCCLVDRLYNHISFSSGSFSAFLSKEKGDGGLNPGQLVFKEEFERFAGKEFNTALREIIQDKVPDKISIGGPSIVALIHATQMLEGTDFNCRFYGCGGNDEDGSFLLSSLNKTQINTDNYVLSGTVTPSTIVLSDPDFDHGNGERIFINSIGAAWHYFPGNLNDDFFASDVVVFGGTALVPAIHDNLHHLLEKAKSSNCITVVNTVYDFRNEKANPHQKWPLGQTDESYGHIDLLITDYEEALRLSGKQTIGEAMQFFTDKKTGAVVVTNGAKNIRVFSSGKLFRKLNDSEMPVSSAISEELKKGHWGDTTGCGDNFVGGILASLVWQLQNQTVVPDLSEACMWGIVSGGYSCFYIGGTYLENHPGEKYNLISPYFEQYKKQIGDGK
ncbi:MAG TPA: carbohydrate kinase family protein [Draconibacterium sp.]|nr:carbohydrate kinase family protein [Draconibacterium sp.]HRX11978.1 carbohydrate kinase family protein [Draconibacterium sp.]